MCGGSRCAPVRPRCALYPSADAVRLAPPRRQVIVRRVWDYTWEMRCTFASIIDTEADDDRIRNKPAKSLIVFVKRLRGKQDVLFQEWNSNDPRVEPPLDEEKELHAKLLTDFKALKAMYADQHRASNCVNELLDALHSFILAFREFWTEAGGFEPFTLHKLPGFDVEQRG